MTDSQQSPGDGAAISAPDDPQTNSSSDSQAPSPLPLGPPVFGRWRLVSVVLPMVVYLLGNFFGGYLEKLRVSHLEEERRKAEAAEGIDEILLLEEDASEDAEALPSGITAWFRAWFPKEKTWYPSTYTITILLTSIIVLLSFPGLLRAPLRVTWLGPAVGVVGIVLWVGLWYLDEHLLGLGARIAPWLGGTRSAFNPFETLRDTPTWMYQFLAIRLFGMIMLVPIVEEFFVRGFLMRYVDDPDWDQVPLGMATWKGIVGVLVYAAISHPAEIVAAVAWFGLVTWLYLRTKSLWDCVAAHAVTNLLLAVFVLTTKTWALW